MRSRRRLFARKKTSAMRLLGGLTLLFAGSFAVAVITFEWPEAPAPTPAQHLAASSPSPPHNDHH